MNSLFTVNNNVSVSLISVTVTPSTFLAALVVVLTFVSLYASVYIGPLTATVAVLAAPIRRFFPGPPPQRPPRPRSTAPATIPLDLGPDLIKYRSLPALPAPETSKALVRSSRRSSSTSTSTTTTTRHARSSRPPRRLPAGLRAPSPPLRPPSPAPRRDRRERPGAGSPGLGLRRWLQSSGLAPPRKRP